MADLARPNRPFPPWERPEPPSRFDLAASARRIGSCAWVEERLFETLGGWVATTPELDVQAALARWCAQHAWHAELWRARLPEIGGQPADDLVRPADPALVELVAALDAPDTIARLVGVQRVVVPRLVAACTYHRAMTNRTTDGPTVRVIELVLADLLAAWREGELLAQSLLGGPDEVARAAAHQGSLEQLMVRAGGIVGPGSLG